MGNGIGEEETKQGNMFIVDGEEKRKKRRIVLSSSLNVVVSFLPALRKLS